MKQLLTQIGIYLITFSLVTVSCTKKGDPGINGTDGKDGAPGNTLYISDSISLTNADYGNGYWTIPIEGGGTLGNTARVATIEVDSITQHIFDSGIVMVYLKNTNNLTNPNQWTQLPFLIRAFNVGYNINVTAGFEVGKIYIYYFFTATDAAEITTVPNIYTVTIPTISFRYVIIPGSAGFGAVPPTKFIDDASMKNYFRIK